MIYKIMEKMIEYYRGDPKRIQHFLKVYTLAHAIGRGEKLSERELYILDIAALVHDIGIKASEEKYGSSAGRYQEQEGPAIAERLLGSLGVDSEAVSRVSYLVGHHHTYNCIEGADYQILVEADFLVNLYEDGESREAVLSARDRIFKTETGKKYLAMMYDL